MIPDVTSAEIFKVFASEIERLGHCNGYEVVRGEIKSRAHEKAVLEARRMARKFAVERVEGVVFRPFIDELNAFDYATYKKNGFRVKHLGDCHCELYDRPEGFSSVPLMCKR